MPENRLTDPTSPQAHTPSSTASFNAATAGWRDAFASLAEVAPKSHTPVALGFELVEVVARTWFEAKHSVVLEKQAVSPGTDPSRRSAP